MKKKIRIGAEIQGESTDRKPNIFGRIMSVSKAKDRNRFVVGICFVFLFSIVDNIVTLYISALQNLNEIQVTLVPVRH